MKRLIFLLVILGMTFGNVYAIRLESGSLIELAEARVAKFEVDYSEAVIHGMSEDEFAQYELDWDNDQYQIIAKFLGNLNDRTGDNLMVAKGKETPLTLRWVVLWISTKGDIKGELHLVAEDGKILAKIVELNGEGGSIGSKLNLIKDGAEDSGKRAGSFLKCLVLT